MPQRPNRKARRSKSRNRIWVPSLGLPLGEHNRSQDGDENQDRSELKRQQIHGKELHRKLLGGGYHGRGGNGACGSAAGAIFAEQKVGHFEQEKYAQRQSDPLREVTGIRAHLFPGIEEHNDENEKHQDRAGVNENLNRRDEGCAEQQVKDRERDHHQNQGQSAVHRLARQNQGERDDNGHDATNNEDEHGDVHQRILRTTTRLVSTRLMSDSGSRNFQPKDMS